VRILIKMDILIFYSFRTNTIPIIYWGSETGFSNGNTTTFGNCDNSTGGMIADFNYDGHLDIFYCGYYSYSYVYWGPDFTEYVSLPVSLDHHGMFFEPGNVYTREYKEEYISSVFDGGNAQLWQKSSWDDSIPLGTEIDMAVKTGDTPSPDSTWTEWVSISNGNTIPHSPISRYIQYKATFAYTTPAILPNLWEVKIEYKVLGQSVEEKYPICTPTINLKSSNFTFPISFLLVLPRNARVSINLFDRTGRKITSLVNNQDFVKGNHSLIFKNENHNYSSGILFIKVRVNEPDGNQYYLNKKLTIVR